MIYLLKHKTRILFAIYIIYVFNIGINLSGILSNSLKCLENTLLYVNCSIRFSDKTNLINILYTMFPTFICVSLVADEVSDDVKKNSMYIFTRTSQRRKWSLKKLEYIFNKVLCINLIFICINLTYFYLSGHYAEDIMNLTLITVKIFILNVLVHYNIIILCNIIVLTFDGMAGYLFCTLSYTLSIALMHTIYFNERTFIYWLPFTQNIVTIQDWNEISRALIYTQNYMEGYGFTKALIYCICFIMVEIFIFLKIIDRKEFY